MKSEATIGVLNLDVEPERVKPQEDTPGFLRSDETFDFCVKREIVRGATIEKVMEGNPELIPNFIEAARKLEARGVKAIAGDCGFTATYQQDIARAVSIPVITSSLIIVPLVYRMLAENKRVGIITANSEKLAERHFNAVGWSSKDIPVSIKGMNEIKRESWQPLEEHPRRDSKYEKDLVNLAEELIQESPDVGAIVAECTLIPPYSYAIQKATGLPVFDITSAIRMVHAAAEPPNWLE